MADEREHEQFIFLSTRIVTSATDMIERVGYLSALRHRGERLPDYLLADLRAAIAKAQSAIDSYDVLIGAGIEQCTVTAFETAARHTADERPA